MDVQLCQLKHSERAFTYFCTDGNVQGLQRAPGDLAPCMIRHMPIFQMSAHSSKFKAWISLPDNCLLPSTSGTLRQAKKDFYSQPQRLVTLRSPGPAP